LHVIRKILKSVAASVEVNIADRSSFSFSFSVPYEQKSYKDVKRNVNEFNKRIKTLFSKDRTCP